VPPEEKGASLYRETRAIKRPARPPTQPTNGTIFAAAAFEGDVVAADPIAEEPEDFAPVPGSLNISSHFI
jgi:hypothetical protein